METLTGKQKDNRLYYAKNAEKIKAQKRASYAKRKAAKPKKVKPVCQSQSVIKIVIESREPALRRSTVTTQDTATRTARRRIEDLKLAEELGIEDF